MQIPLSDILLTHEKFSSESALSDCLGDGFLCRHNHVFRNLRVAAQKAGLKFTKDDDIHYSILSLAALPEILERGLVPYFDNVALLKKLEQSRPGLFSLAEIPDFKRNYLLHESAHFLAHKLIPQAAITKDSLQTEREFALKMLLGESFANTCDTVAACLAETPVHRAFFRLNSYMTPPEPFLKAYERSVCAIGSRSVFKAIFIGYLFSNFHYEKMTKKGIDLTLALSAHGKSPSVRDRAAVKQIVSFAFTLNPTFRTVTAKFFFRLLGLKHELSELLDFNFISRVFKDPRLCTGIDQLIDVAELGSFSADRVESQDKFSGNSAA